MSDKITLNGIVYIPASEFCNPVAIGDVRIIVADRSWVWVGNCKDEDNGDVTITNAKNIRIWGTTKGLGELVNGPTSKTITDDYGTVRCRPIITIAVKGGW